MTSARVVLFGVLAVWLLSRVLSEIGRDERRRRRLVSIRSQRAEAAQRTERVQMSHDPIGVGGYPHYVDVHVRVGVDVARRPDEPIDAYVIRARREAGQETHAVAKTR